MLSSIIGRNHSIRLDDDAHAPDTRIIPEAIPGRGSWLSNVAASTWDMSPVSRIAENIGDDLAVRRAGQWDADWHMEEMLHGLTGTTGQMETRSLHAMTEEEWKASPHYRKGISWERFGRDMTPARAERLAESHDERSFRNLLIAAGDEKYDTILDGPLKFAAAMAGGIPDPLNFVAFTGALGAAKAAWTGAKAFGVGGLKGMAEAGIATGIWDAIAIPDLASRGEELGLADAIWDQAISAPIGFLLGGVGGVVGLRRARFVAEQERLIRERMAGADFGRPDSFFDLFMDESAPASTGRTVRDIQADWARQLRDAETAGGGRYDEKQIADTVGLVTAHYRSLAEINGIGTAEAMEAFGGFRSLAPDEVDAIVAGGGRRLDSPILRVDIPEEILADIPEGSIRGESAARATAAAKAWVKENIREPVQTVIGPVRVSAWGVGDSLNHTAYQNKFDAVMAIRPVLERGAYLGDEMDFAGGSIRNHYFAGRAVIGGRERIVFVRVIEKAKGGKFMYVHEVFTNEDVKRDPGPRTNISSSVSSGGGSLPLNVLRAATGVNGGIEAVEKAAMATRRKADAARLKARADLFGRIAEQIAECVGRIA